MRCERVPAGAAGGRISAGRPLFRVGAVWVQPSEREGRTRVKGTVQSPHQIQTALATQVTVSVVSSVFQLAYDIFEYCFLL